MAAYSKIFRGAKAASRAFWQETDPGLAARYAARRAASKAKAANKGWWSKTWRGAEGYGVTRTAGRVGSNVLRGTSRMVGNPAFYLPVVGGALVGGFAKGIGGEMMKDPVTFAWAMDAAYSGGGFNKRNELGMPLGVVNENPNYMVSPWRLPPNNPLLAGGELMLATFATRHGR